MAVWKSCATDRGLAAVLTTRPHFKQTQARTITNDWRKYSLSAIRSRQRKHLSSAFCECLCCLLKQHIDFFCATSLSFPCSSVRNCKNDWRKQCVFLFSIAGDNTDGLIFLQLSHSALPVLALCFMSLLSLIKIYYFHQQREPESCQQPIVCA